MIAWEILSSDNPFLSTKRINVLNTLKQTAKSTIRNITLMPSSCFFTTWHKSSGVVEQNRNQLRTIIQKQNASQVSVIRTCLSSWKTDKIKYMPAENKILETSFWTPLILVIILVFILCIFLILVKKSEPMFKRLTLFNYLMCVSFSFWIIHFGKEVVSSFYHHFGMVCFKTFW